MASSTTAPTSIRRRAINLLTSFFALDNPDSRRAILNTAFDSTNPSPAQDIDPTGPLSVFASRTVDQLLAYGALGRGKHALALLIEHMACARGRQTNPDFADFADLPALLNATCALPTRAEQRAYLTRLIKETEEKARFYSPLAGIAAKHPDRAPAKLPGLLPDDIQQVLLRHQPRHRDNPAAESPAPARDYDDILTAFDQIKHAALLGTPGAGKSTTLRRLAVDLAQRALSDAAAPLPILASLGDWLGDEPLGQFLAFQSSEIGWAMEALAAEGKLILLLDGLNEVPTAKRQAKALDIKTTCETFKKLHAGNAVFTSCRREDYVGDLDLGLETLTLEPLSPQRIERALQKWVALGNEPPETAGRIFWQLAGDERLQGVHTEWLAKGLDPQGFWSPESFDWKTAEKIGWSNYGLWHQHLSNPRSLLRLASNPFMLAMLFQVWLNGRELPPNRGDLFRRFVDTLLLREKLHATEDAGILLNGLAELAWRMQTERIAAREQASAGDFGVLTVASRQAVLDCLQSESLLKRAQDATLLEGSDQLRFRHQLLQEYFTACALLHKITSLSASQLWPSDHWWERSGWEETVVLLAGFFSEDCSAVIRWVAAAQPEVAAQCIEQSGAEVANKESILREFQSAWLPRLTDTQLEPRPEARAALGRALGRLLLDSRKGVGLRPNGLPDIDWVEILGGEFIYQEGERRKLETFKIARYPVTNIQWQAFLNANDGYPKDAWWQGLSSPHRTPEPSTWSEPNHPVTDVSWFEAVAFCRWLASRFGLPVRLPTEWEWERAARGQGGREYPWVGAYVTGYANINETALDTGPHYLQRTSPVGMYPKGVTDEGVHDLAGNVWEWCLNEYQNPKRIQFAGESARVLRGGSWYLSQGYARAAYRFNVNPGSRDDSIGFRVVVSSPIGKAGRRGADH